MPEKKSNRNHPKNSHSAALGRMGPNVLLGVSGGIAAYKAVDLASKLTAAGARVNTVMTENACRLICPKSFEAVTNSAVFTGLWDTNTELKTSHINLVDWADIVVVAPATANIIGKIANGICDDLLSTTLCVCWPLIKSGAALLAPAMNDNMWNNPAVQRNIKTLKKMGFQLIGPVKGRLACGTEGLGRMAEPQDILKAIEKIVSKIKHKKT
jgi:phosphopantothenoylcysteine decarboxylase/phosphopantothenate--cysteine ligase